METIYLNALNWYRSVGLQRRLRSFSINHLQELNHAGCNFSSFFPMTPIWAALSAGPSLTPSPPHGNYLVVFFSAFITASFASETF
jgi:hypothetical protein